MQSHQDPREAQPGFQSKRRWSKPGMPRRTSSALSLRASLGLSGEKTSWGCVYEGRVQALSACDVGCHSNHGAGSVAAPRCDRRKDYLIPDKIRSNQSQLQPFFDDTCNMAWYRLFAGIVH